MSRIRPRSKLGNWNQKCKCREHTGPGNICEDSGPDAPGFPHGHLGLGCQAERDKRRKIRKTAGGEGRQGVRTVTPKGQAGGGACGPWADAASRWSVRHGLRLPRVGRSTRLEFPYRKWEQDTKGANIIPHVFTTQLRTQLIPKMSQETRFVFTISSWNDREKRENTLRT